jgi:Cytochrome c
MKHVWLTTLALCSGLVGLAAGFTSRTATGAPPAGAIEAPPGVDARGSLITRGEHLVATSGCSDCHTPLKMGKNGPEPDMARRFSGHPEGTKLPPAPAASGPWLTAVDATNTAWSGPWGVSFTANLTPDVETGLGGWSQGEFAQAMKTGRHRGRGRPVLPPMPIAAYRNFTDDELAAIFAYLGSIPAIKNRVPEPLPPQGTHG